PTSGPPRRRFLLVDLETQAPALVQTGEKLRIVRQWRRCGRQQSDAAVAHIVAGHEVDGLRLQDLRASGLAAIQNHANELQVVSGRRVEAATTHLELWLLRYLQLDLRLEAIVVAALMNLGEARAHGRCDLEGRTAHAEGGE